MMKIIGMALAVLLFVALLAQVAGFGVAYTVDETEFVVITRFGEVQRGIISPGLKFKSPVESVVRFDKRLLRIDVPVASMPDRDSQFLEIDAYIRYRISDPQVFLENLRDEFTAGQRIGSLAISAIRDEVGVRDRKDIIGGDPITQSDGTIIVKPRQTEEGNPSRAEMMQLVLHGLRENTEEQWGVEVVDVRIKRADFPTAAEASVFDRMRSERSVQAQRLRAEGAEQFLTITADVSRRVRIIRANADRDGNILSGEGEAQAVQIFARVLGTGALRPEALDALDALESLSPEVLDAIGALDVEFITDETIADLRAGNVLSVDILEDVIKAIRALGPETIDSMELVIGFEAANALRALAASGDEALNPIDSQSLAEALEFFTFRRSLEAYTNSLQQDTTLVLSADSELFRYLQGPTVAKNQQNDAEAFLSLFSEMAQYMGDPDSMSMDESSEQDQDSSQ